jgi:hypothetical protein
MIVETSFGPVEVKGGHRKVVPLKKPKPDAWPLNVRSEAAIRADLAKQLWEIEHKFWRAVRKAEWQEKKLAR